MSTQAFQFKKFKVTQENCAMKIGTDSVLLGAWANTKNAHNILDIGTGTGVIALMMAQKNTTANIYAVEIDEASAKEAQQNAADSPWKNRLIIEHTAIQDFAKGSRLSFDLIVCNPPFFTGGVIANKNNRAIARHTIKLPNGELLNAARNLLSKRGKFCVILPLIEGLRFKEQAKSYRLFCTKMTEVYPQKDKKIERLLLQFELEDKKEIKDILVVQNNGANNWTKEYKKLTSDFYL